MPQTRKGRKDIENSGYYRALASKDDDVAALEIATMFSENQAQVISNGTKLDNEFIIDPRFNNNIVIRNFKSKNLVDTDCNGHYSHFCVMKEDCTDLKKGCIQIDYLTIDETSVHVYEVKDGDNFDTKKSEGEVESLRKAHNYFARVFPNKAIKSYVVLWNATDTKKVSFKANDLPKDFIMLGREFCNKNSIDFDAITKHRMLLAEKHKEYIVQRMRDILSLIDNNE